MFRFGCLLASILFILCLNGVLCGQSKIPRPPNKAPIAMTLRNVEVRDELGLNQDQVEKIEKIHRKMLTELAQLRAEGNASGSATDVDATNIAAVHKARMDDADKDITKDVLLEFQSKRLKQIQWRIELNRIGIDRFLKNEAITSYLEMTEKEMDGIYPGLFTTPIFWYPITTFSEPRTTSE